MRNLFKLAFILLFSISSALMKSQSLKELSESISNDTNFINLNKNLESFSEHNYDLETLNSLIKKEDLTIDERIKVVNAFGFKGIDDFDQFNNKNIEYIQSIKTKFSLQNYSDEEMSILLNDSFGMLSPIIGGEEVEANGRSCAERLKTCKKGAKALYFIEVGGCVGLGVTIAGASFGSAALFGYGAYMGCSIAASVHLGSMLETCQDNYDDCKEK